MKKIVGLMIILIFVISCNNKSYLKERTVEELREFKKQGKPTSELDKCFMEVNKDEQKYQDYLKQCKPSKIEKIKENITNECLKKKEQDKKDPYFPIERDCTWEGIKFDTIGAESYVNSKAEEDCDKEAPEELKNRLTLLDCSALVSK